MTWIHFLLFAVFFSCTTGNDNSFSEESAVEVTLKPEVTYQEIHNFGASDAWSCQFVGNWPDEIKNRIADLLFSLEINEDGSPKGIGLSCWRFNIGAGSARQGNDSGIDDPWRRAESFLQDDDSYNWDKQSAQRWFLQAAEERGVETFIGFVNSPPVALTKNGKAHSDGGNSMNLTAENLPKFSEYLVEVIQNIQQNEGVLFDYLSPVNEPQWDWEGGQEGSPWKNSEIAQLCQILGNDLKNAGLSTQIEITEAGQLNHLYEAGNDAERGNQIREFFSPTSDNFVGDIPNMAHKIAGHSYFTTTNDEVLKEVRTKLRKEIEQVDPELEFSMSEFCILGDNDGFRGNGRDLGMETALFVANVIHADLTIANASAWHWWLAVSPYDYKDGLVYIDKNKTGGDIYESKLLWALGNYSRFVRPGATRISAEYPETSDLKISAFQNKNGELVTVVLNRGNSGKELKLNLPGSSKTGRIYETSEQNDLKYLSEFKIRDEIQIAPRSVTTLVWNQP
ncbi:O-Glycosyl hydrolase [Tangfeifania diversioriginum]|uniref:O-Glycosyl hydrolase n=1 Tax=Tangfeifania diversioriginum TaxID=1168035 RepID=A0A1M6H9R9_9BACT|nr:glycoside hydrolase family 30 protein [Tangfeifania diversioriginum]SHJ18968.1 O-Glycosyl hydrolase [Tangfeifania diversioriginum]